MASFGDSNCRQNPVQKTFHSTLKILLYLLPFLFTSASAQPICKYAKLDKPGQADGTAPDEGGNRKYPICWPSSDTTVKPGVCLDIIDLAVLPISYTITVGDLHTGVLPFTCSSYWSKWTTKWPTSSTLICGNTFTYTATISSPISTMTLNAATKNFNLAAYSFSMIGTHTITLKAEATDTANMDPIPG